MFKAGPDVETIKDIAGNSRAKLSPVRRIVFTVIMTLLCLLGAEGIFRLTQKPRDYEQWRRTSLRYDYDPRYHWTIRPGEYLNKKSGRIECINRIGLRCPEVAPHKAAGSVRVFALGGSSTYIVSPETGLGWTDLLGAKLTQLTGVPVEVINAGTPGYSAYQLFMRLKYQLLAYDPDIVLIYSLSNDMKLFSMNNPEEMIAKWDRHGQANAEYTLLNPNPVLDALCRWSQIATHLRFRV